MRRIRHGLLEFGEVVVAAGALTAAFLYPLSLHPATLSRSMSADGQFSVWNVAWVARTLVADPRQVLDANIFYPHERTLLYSEANLAAGALAAPVYWLTQNPYLAHNFVVLLSFVMSATATYYLVRYLTGDRRGAVVAAVLFAFAPHLFAHLQHVQLLMTAGIPLALLAFHRLVDRPSAWRGVILGLAMAAETYACAYYAIFLMLMIPAATLVTAGTRRLWRSQQYWSAIATAAAVAIAATLPLTILYSSLQRQTGFTRELLEARLYAADWRSYLASPAYLHRWILPLLGKWQDVLFPGFTALATAVAGAVAVWRWVPERRDTVLLYGTLAVLAMWASAGPDAGLYRVLYATMPGFTLLRAASRFGLIVLFSVAVLAGVGVPALLSRSSRPRAIFALVAALAGLESIEHVRYKEVPPVAPAYRLLAQMRRGALIELPLYSQKFAHMRTRYMLGSTAHWQPLVNGYSDYIPHDFVAVEGLLGRFPSAESFALLKRDGVRYAIFHVKDFKGQAHADLLARLAEFGGYLTRLYADDQMWLYEITGYP